MNFINIKNICKTSILSVLLFLLFTHNLQSQCLGCPTIDIPCVGGEGGGVQLFLRINSFGEGNVCASCCEQPSCRRTMYQVQLGIKGSYLPNFTGQCFSLNYTELILQAGITTQEGWLTNLNKKLTEICPGPGLANSPNDGSLYSLIADEGSDITTLTLGGVLTDPGEPVPTICFNREQTQPTLHTYITDVLFTMVVDYFPGEDIQGQGAFPLGITYTNGASGQTCFGTGIGQGNNTPPYNNPPTTNNNTILSVETPVCTNEVSTFPVNITSGTGSVIEYLDFGFVVETDVTTLFGVPTFTNLFPGMTPTFVPLPNNTGYNIHIVYENVTIPPGTTTLFNLNVVPLNFSAGTNVTTTLVPGRVITASGGCQTPRMGAATQTCTIDPPVACNDYWFTASPNTYFPGGSCSNLSVTVLFNGPSGFTGDMDLRIDFNLDQDITITNATFNGTGTPVVSGNSVILSGANIAWSVGNNFMTITFGGNSGCIQGALFREATIRPAGSSDFCAPAVFVADFPACAGELVGEIKMAGGCFVNNVTVNKIPQTDPSGCNFTLLDPVTTNCGPYSSCMCPNVSKWIIRPEKNDDLYETDPISEDDFIAISQHILGITPLNSPYKMIAADATMDGAITTYDIVELRKLKLGIYNSGSPWPSGYAPSWRFVDKNFVFPNPINPFESPFPEEIQTAMPNATADFVAIKIGSLLAVDGVVPSDVCEPLNCDPFLRPAKVEDFEVKIDTKTINAGELTTIPIYASNTAPLVAWQMGIRFDVNELDFISVTPGDLPNMNADNFGLTSVQQGLIRSSWLAQLDNPEDYVHPGDVLFYVTLRAKQPVINTNHLIDLNNKVLSCSGWLADFTKFNLKQVNSKEVTMRNGMESGPTFSIGCRPNPSTSDFVMDITVEYPTVTDLTIYDALGKTVLHKTVSLSAGMQVIPINESMQWPSGVYRWNIKDGNGINANGQFIKQ